MASPPPLGSLATSCGQRRCRSTAPRFPADDASPPSSPATPSGCRRHYLEALRSPSGRRPHCRWLYPWRQHPRYRRLASRCCPAEQRLASCESNGAVCSPRRLVMAINRRRVFPKRPRTGKRTLRGNISPLCIQIKLIMARIDPHVFVLPCKMPLGIHRAKILPSRGVIFVRNPQIMHSANILPPPSPRAAPLSLFAISDAVSCHPVAPHPGPSASQSAAASALPCCLFSPTVRRCFRTPRAALSAWNFRILRAVIVILMLWLVRETFSGLLLG